MLYPALSARSSRSTGFLLAVALGLLASPSLASPTYPTVVKNTVPMSCTPDCTICHQEPQPTSGVTATQPFAIQLRENGLVALDDDSLIAALQATVLSATPSNVDQDMYSDAVELNGSMAPQGQLTTNPNVSDASGPSANVCPPEPLYGCGAAHVTPRPHVHTELILLGLLAFGVGLGIWRRAAQRRSS